MPLSWPKMCSKSAKNGPKHLKFTSNSIYVSTFRKYEQQFKVVENLAAVFHFSLKKPWNPYVKGNIPFSAKSRKKH